MIFRPVVFITSFCAYLLTASETQPIAEQPVPNDIIRSHPYLQQQQSLANASTQQIIRACNRIQDLAMRRKCLSQIRK